MIYKSHYIELWVNGNSVEFESQESINVRFQNVLFDPTKIASTQAEYSFEFELPCTPVNNRIFDFANDLAKLNKFHTRWNAELYADGNLIFEGSLTLNSVKNNMYKCNLVSVKSYNNDDIFGEAVMTDIRKFDGTHWEIPFDGAGDTGYTINYYNEQNRNDVCFPLVSYGVFQKSPSGTTAGEGDEDALKVYTSKFDMDKYNRWYIESFYPSISMLETMKRCYEFKGYTVAGDAFQDTFLKNVFMSVNLSDGQAPTYNLGNPKFGSVSLSASLSTSGKTPYQQELNFPYFKVFGNVQEAGMLENRTEYNMSSVMLYDILADGNVTVNSPTYLYQPNEHIIVIPASGFYKIQLTASTTLNSTGSINVMHHIYDPLNRTMDDETISLAVGMSENTPVEIALIRNYEDNYELIKGKNNKNYETGNPNQQTYTIDGRVYPNVNEWLTCFPHEDAYGSTTPTKQNDLTLYNTQGRRRVDGSVSTNVGQRRARGTTVDGSGFNGDSGRDTTVDDSGFESNSGRRWTPIKLGYVYRDGEIMAYDQAVSPAFVCGMSSFYGGVTSVMKNGYSWSKSNADENYGFYPEIGYDFMKRNTSGGTDFEETQYNYNTYINTPISYVNATNTTMNGYVSCMVYLEKDDVLQLMAVHRGFETAGGANVYYNTTTNISLEISAASPRSYQELKAAKYTYNSPTEFDVNLNLANFFNSEKKISDWVQNTIDAFNLDVVQDGNNIMINTKKRYAFDKSAVNIDDRCSSSDAESQAIEYPRSMAIKYKIDVEEWGYEKSVYPQSKLNDPDWYKYGDSGFTTIELNDDSYVTSSSEKSLSFSYTWYDNFNWIAVDSSFEQNTATTMNLRIPVISKYSYMIDGYSYEESMKYDGYGLSQRFWFRPTQTDAYVWTRTYPVEKINVYVPSNQWSNGEGLALNLSYKTTERSLLKEYFNINAYLASNFVEIDVYLNPEEYYRLKNGALVHFDSDIYDVVEISGFDPSGYNTTTLKLMKKVV